MMSGPLCSRLAGPPNRRVQRRGEGGRAGYGMARNNGQQEAMVQEEVKEEISETER